MFARVIFVAVKKAYEEQFHEMGITVNGIFDVFCGLAWHAWSGNGPGTTHSQHMSKEQNPKSASGFHNIQILTPPIETPNPPNDTICVLKYSFFCYSNIHFKHNT